jgi:elongation factor P--beta-lysine ligase
LYIIKDRRFSSVIIVTIKRKSVLLIHSNPEPACKSLIVLTHASQKQLLKSLRDHEPATEQRIKLDLINSASSI